MKYRKLGTTNIDVSVICLGTMTFGEQNSQQDGFDQMDYALERGVNFFDTAEVYPVMPRKETYGKTEEIIGNWFKQRKNRSKIILASKIASKTEDDLPWIREGAQKLGFDKKNMNAAIDASLQRLQTDFIDLYQLHWPERKIAKFGKMDFEFDPNDNKWTQIEEVLDNLNNLIKAGKIRYVGLSNETPWGVMKFLNVAKEKILPRMMSIQNAYNLVNRVFDISNSEVSIREECGLLAYSPLAGGVLSGKYLDDNNPPNARMTLFEGMSKRYSGSHAENAVRSYKKIAENHNLNFSQMSLNFITRQKFVSSNIIGATSLEQLNEDLESINCKLSDEVISEIEEVHKIYTYPCP